MDPLPQALGTDMADLEAARHTFEAALGTGDAAAIASSYADDATLVAPAGELLRGRPAIERFWRTGVEIGIGEVAFAVLDLRLRGDIALEVGEYALHVAQDSGARAINRGRYLVVLRIEPDGQWRRTAEMFSPDRTAIPAP